MAPTRIMIIRHAEHHADPGFTEDDEPGEQSLTIRGWQRAGALVGLFGPRGDPDLVPDAIFTSTIGHDSPSHRPVETVAPLYAVMEAVMEADGGVHYDRSFPKPDVEGLMGAVMKRSGNVLICWEHSCIPDAVAALPNAPKVPEEWPSERYDLIWILDRDGTGWRFSQRAQRLLAGDAPVA